MSLALGADATFVGRAMDSDRKGLTDVLRQAAEHQGTSLVEIYQNCNIFNDGAFELLKDPATGTQWSIPLEHGKPLVFGPDGASCVVQDDFGGLRIAETNQVDAARDRRPRRAPARTRPTRSRCPGCPARTCGTRRWASSARSQKPTYDAMMAEQLDVARPADPSRRPTWSTRCSPEQSTWTAPEPATSSTPSARLSASRPTAGSRHSRTCRPGVT